MDDKEEERYLAETLLKGSGYEVETAVDGAEALEKLRAEGFDMIISDVLMPVMDGFRLCRECKGDEKLKDIPFIFYTATYKDERDEELASKVGADRFIQKPIEPEEFVKIVQGVSRDVEEGKIGPKKRVLEEERDVLKLYSERLIEKLEKKMLDLEAEITQRKQAEEELQIAEQNFRNSLDNSPLGIRIVTAEGEFLYANQAILDIYGYSSIKELKTTPIKKRYTPQSYAGHQKRKEKRKLGQPVPPNYEISIVRKDGEIRNLIVSRKAVVWGGEVQYQAIYQDITGRKQAEQALRQSEEFSSSLLSNSPSPMLVANPDTSIKYVNPALEKLTGFTSTEVTGRKAPYPWWAEETLQKTDSEFREALVKGATSVEELFQKKNGERFWVEITATTVIQNGEPKYYLASWVDITDRKQAEEALQEERNFLNNILTSIQDGISILDNELHIVSTNLTMERWYAHAMPLVGKKCYQAYHSRGEPCEVCPTRQTLETGETAYEVVPKREAGGEVIGWLELYSFPLVDMETGQTKGTIEYARDITERERAEEALRQSEEFSSSLLSNSPNPMLVANPDTSIKYVNPALEKLSGFSSTEVIGRKIPYPWWTGETLPKTRTDFEKDTRKGIKGREELFQKKNGERFWVQITATTVIQNGEPKYYLATWVDITERKRAEEALQESEEHYRAILNAGAHMGEAIFLVQDTDKVEAAHPFANEEWARITGYTTEELRRTSYYDIIHPRHRAAVADRVRRRLQQGQDIPGHWEISVITKDGAEVPIEVIGGCPITYHGKPASVGYARDITERKKMEEALRESEEGYRALVNLGAEVGEAVTMAQDTEQGEAIHIFANDEWLRITGYSREELLGMSFFDLLHPEHREASLKRHRSKMSGEAIPGLFEVTIIRKDGTEVPIELTGAQTTYHGKPANVAYMRDITERKKMEEQLMVTDRLASLGELVSGVAHELNNPLTSVIGFSELLLDKDVPDDVKEDLEVINREAKRTAGIVRNLLTFARKHPEEKRPVDINNVIQKVLELRAYEQKVSNIQVVTQFASDLPEIAADGFQLQQVFLNIIINAEHFMTEAHRRGTLTITTERVGDIIRASFADDGHGIAEENMGHVFDPFFTTKEVGKGTGLGLSICHGTVTEHGGKIYAESELGKGATFIVELPITK